MIYSFPTYGNLKRLFVLLFFFNCFVIKGLGLYIIYFWKPIENFVAYCILRLESTCMKIILKLYMAQACNPGTQKAEAGGLLQVHG